MVLLVVYFYVYLVIRPFCVFKDSAGMWEQDKFRPLVSALVNLLLNIITVRFIGLYGVIGSTIVAVVFVSMPWVILNINTNMFHLNVKTLLIKEFTYGVTAVGCCILTWNILKLFVIENSLMNIVIRLVVSVIIPILVFGGVFLKTKENQYVMSHWRGLLKGKV